eukprot:TRINITY_DN33473_c0_g1_i1.p1 TRINITY_DN33473_c0_g1~~TRINITY_DN33473_c0_g1_i1.p1  ORF type:complete len:335 (+),score=45.26 TRINITY_DN33473_c0_g1_i1:104-1108(+)
MGCRSSLCKEEDLLLDESAASTNRIDLQCLTRQRLRQRLLFLGAAKTEGDGLAFKELVNTVILWNILAGLRTGERAKVEQSLRALRESCLSRSVLERGLIVVGMPQVERKALNRDSAETLLHHKLSELASIADRGVAGLAQSELPLAALPTGVGEQRNVASDVYGGCGGSNALKQPQRSSLKPARKTAGVGVLNSIAEDAFGQSALWGNEDIGRASFPNSDDHPSEGDLETPLTRTLREIVDTQTSDAASIEPECEPEGRERKFEALEADLIACLDAEARTDQSFFASLFDRVPSVGPGSRADFALARELPSRKEPAGKSNSRGRPRQRGIKDK